MGTKKRSKNVEDHANQLNRYEKLIKGYINYWVPVLGLTAWVKIEVCCVPDSHENRPGVVGETFVDWRYMEADIDFYMGSMISGKMDDKRVEYVVVHELCHCMVNEMRDENTDDNHRQMYIIPHEERVVSNLATAFLRAKYETK